MSDEKAILTALEKFAEDVKTKMSQLIPGEPEDQLRGPFDSFMQEVGSHLNWKIVCTGEAWLPGRMGKPDFAIHLNKLLAGYVELKAPGVGAKPSRFKGHNREQWKRFKIIPNLLYCDGNEWGLYRDGKAVGAVVCLSGDVATDGKNAVEAGDASAVLGLLRDFLNWEPILPTNRKGRIDLKGFAHLLAPLCRMMRDDVTDALKDADSPLVHLAEDWRQLLFPDASDAQFADAYAQTVTFALLLARSEGADPLTLDSAGKALAADHSLLSRALQVLTDPKAQDEISASLNLLIRVIDVVPPTALAAPEDPWIYFYEDFLAVYDPKLRKKAGAYYTPVEVVRAQVRLIDDLLTNRLGKPLGFADRDVVTLDPGLGTGTYLLGVIDHALAKVEDKEGPGAVPGKATALAKNLYGFELMVGPYAVAELRVSRDLQDKGAKLPAEGTHIYLTDTLESPFAEPTKVPLFLKPIADQHRKALEVKGKVPVIVCLGNPPYERHEAADASNKARTGGWVRWGDENMPEASIILDSFIGPATQAGHGVHIKNLYNLYVYFWRWALWKVFEHETSTGPGVVSYISASSYLDGDAFCGMREHMRRMCDEIWILDLGGELRGTRKSENVFDIQTPVAIAVAFRQGMPKKDTPAKVHYARVDGTRKEKLKALDDIHTFAGLTLEDCPDEWHAPFRPKGTGEFFEWPLLNDLFPWQQSGVKAGRTWVIGPEAEMLKRCWKTLCEADKENRATLFKNSPTGRKVYDTTIQLPPADDLLEAVINLPRNSTPPDIVRYAFRSFDRQYLFADARLLDRPAPSLWYSQGDKQVYLSTLLTSTLGTGPALTVCAAKPDLHHFSGRGAKDTIPFYRDPEGKEANISPGLLEMLSKALGTKVTPEDFLAYVYGMLAQPAYTARFVDELGSREIRVPIAKDKALFEKVRDIGRRLLWLHTYGERFVPQGSPRGQIPTGQARCEKPVSGDPEGYPEDYEYNDATQTLRVGDGEFRPVAPEVFDFEVSGLKVVYSWLKYRMKRGAGRKSSQLDDIRPERWTGEFTTELLELLWVLEATVEGYPEQAELLEAVIEGPCFSADELPEVPEEARKAPAKPTAQIALT